MDLKIESVELTFASNGVIVDFRGQNPEGDWCTRKEVFPTWITASERAQLVWQSRFDGAVFQEVDIDL
jgi:hypothetical protein